MKPYLEKYDQIIYIGDSTGDLCACLQLSKWVESCVTDNTAVAMYLPEKGYH